MTPLVWPQSCSFMVEPGADVVQWVQLGVVSKNDSAAAKAARLFHNWAPVTEKPFKVASPWTASLKNVPSDSLLR